MGEGKKKDQSFHGVNKQKAQCHKHQSVKLCNHSNKAVKICVPRNMARKLADRNEFKKKNHLTFLFKPCQEYTRSSMSVYYLQWKLGSLEKTFVSGYELMQIQ